MYLVWSYLVASETGRFAIRVALATFWSLWGADLLTCLVFSEYFFLFSRLFFSMLEKGRSPKSGRKVRSFSCILLLLPVPQLQSVNYVAQFLYGISVGLCENL